MLWYEGKLSGSSLDNYTFNATGGNCSRISYPRSKAVAAVLDTVVPWRGPTRRPRRPRQTRLPLQRQSWPAAARGALRALGPRLQSSATAALRVMWPTRCRRSGAPTASPLSLALRLGHPGVRFRGVRRRVCREGPADRGARRAAPDVQVVARARSAAVGVRAGLRLPCLPYGSRGRQP